MMMFGFVLLLLVGFILVVGVIAGLAWLNRADRQGKPLGVSTPSENREQITAKDGKRFCSHCGAGLQPDWPHCPQCGAPTGS